MIKDTKTSPSKENILDATEGGFNIFAHYIPGLKENHKSFKAVFREDTHPSASVYLNPTTLHWDYKDFGDGKNLSAFDFVMQLKNCDFKESLEIIINDLCLNLGHTSSSRTSSNGAPKAKAKPKEYSIETGGKFTYWLAYADKESVTKAQETTAMVSLKRYTDKKGEANEYTVTATEDRPIFAFKFSDKCHKIYSPGGDNGKHLWIGDKPPGNIFGIEQLPEHSDTILIVEGPKDWFVCLANGISSVAVDNAGTLISEEAVTLLRSKCDNLIICMDIDGPGTDATERLSKQHQLHSIVLPAEIDDKSYGKDISDLFKAGGTKADIEQLIQEAIKKPLPDPVEETTDKPDIGTSKSIEEVIEECKEKISKDAKIDEVNEVLSSLDLGGFNEVKKLLFREEIMKLLKERGIKSGGKIMDAALKVERKESGSDKQGQGFDFKETEPCEDNVDGAELFDEIMETLQRYIFLPNNESYIAEALWIFNTYVHDHFDTSPMLALSSPEKRCGKTRNLDVIQNMVPKPVTVANITPSSVFRMVEAWQPTLLVDEADTFLDEKEGLVGILNSSHYRSGAYVVRTVGDEHEPRRFATWCPKVIAAIGTLPPTIVDRSIVINMKRKTSTEEVVRLRGDRISSELLPIRRKLKRWALDNETLLGDDPEVPIELNDRAADSWRPLISIAQQLGEDIYDNAKNAAISLSGETEEHDTVGTALLLDIQVIFKRDEDKAIKDKVEVAVAIKSQTLIDALLEKEEGQWSGWNHSKGMSKVQLARQLGKYKIKSKQIRFGETTCKGYEKDSFKDAFARYLVKKEDPNEDTKTSENRDQGQLPI